MQENTRMKKYEGLRTSINEESKEVVGTPKLSRFAKRLNTIDSAYFQPIVDQLQQESQQKPFTELLPARAKKEGVAKTNENDLYFDEDQILARAMRLSNQKETTSDDDMLNQFLKEIRSYNMKQGVRSQEDTRLEILKQVRVEMEEEKEKAKPKRAELSSDTEQRLSIARQVKEMIQSGNSDQPTTHEMSRSYQESLDQERMQRQRLLEETQQLRLQLSEHEEELDEIGSGIDYTRKLLNLLVALLLVTVLIAGAILGYLILNK